MNKGDAAMRIAAAEGIKRAISDASITILTPFPEIDRGVYDERIVPCSRRRPAKALRAVTCALLWSALHRTFGLNLGRLLSSEEMRAYKEADLIVDLSGDGLTEEYGSKCALSHLVPVLIGLALKKPVFVCALTIGPFARLGLPARMILN
jgi:hypothetical protein